jgi:MSHA biogenesis protein MshG
VRVGESTGTLERSLAELAQYLQEDKIVKDAISSALRYPMMVVIAIALAVGIITTFVIPRFAPLFEILGDDIPLPTLILLGASTFAAENGIAVIATIALTIFGLNRYATTQPGRRLFDRFKLRLPVVGTLVLQGSIARVLRSLSISLNAGLPMIEALSTIARTAGNVIVAEKVLMIRDAVERGDSMQRALAAAELFPPLVLQMVSTGEETGAMPEMLAEVADYYQRETSNSLKNLTAMIEPLLVIAVGGIVLVLALGVFLPMWNMISKVGAAAA